MDSKMKELNDQEVRMASDDLRIAENNKIIEHVEAIRAIVERKCGSCDPGINGCMDCLFDSIDIEKIPAALDRILDLMHHMPNDKHDIVAAGRERHERRERRWRELMRGDKPCIS